MPQSPELNTRQAPVSKQQAPVDPGGVKSISSAGGTPPSRLSNRLAVLVPDSSPFTIHPKFVDGISNQVATVTDRAVGVGQATGTTPHLSDFVGTGALNASVELFDHGTVENLSATPVLGITTQMMSGNFTLTVTYTFTPLAPGPARVHVHATAALTPRRIRRRRLSPHV